MPGQGDAVMNETRYTLEHTNARDVFYDFCLWEYEPLTRPEGKLSSANLLFHSFETAGAGAGFFDLIQLIREGFGVSRTVWGVKKSGEHIHWEFYFYDYRRRKRQRSITRFLDIVRSQVGSNIKANENLHYFMFSVDIDEDLVSGARDLDEIHLYIGNPGSKVSSGICYSLTDRGMRLENFYFFFDSRTQQKEIVVKAMTSAHLDATLISMDRILWPELRGCQVIVVANKQDNDAVYYSRINVDQLVFFLKRMGYPQDLVFFVEEMRGGLDHLFFDAGFDYRMEGKDLAVLKSGFYGFF